VNESNGKKPVPVGKAKVTLKDHHVQVEGPKGKLELNVSSADRP
jgi:ribosomal protein L6P/L9E